MIFAALWGDVILLPALLAGPLGAVIEAVEKRRNVKTVPAAPVQLETSIEANSVQAPAIPAKESSSKGNRAASIMSRVPHVPRIRPAIPEKSQ